jgi:hypothetical protein
MEKKKMHLIYSIFTYLTSVIWSNINEYSWAVSLMDLYLWQYIYVYMIMYTYIYVYAYLYV